MIIDSPSAAPAAGRNAPAGTLLRPSIVALLLAALAGPACAASPPAASAPRGATPTTQAQHPGDAAPTRAAPAQDADAGTRSVAARARMSECGHQWNNMKRTGTATGTWKEFSRNCLAQK